MFHGGVLDGRIYMTTLDENMQFMGATLEPAAVLPSALRQRPFVEAALFWFNPRWEPYAADTVLLRTLRPEWAQGARLYLGDRQNLPLFDYNSALANPGLRSIAAVGLEILKRHAVPVYADSPAR